MQILPSGGEQAPGPAGLELAPFRGIRYAPERVSGLAEVTSPPYDVIALDTAQQLRDADPHNVVRLILPRQDPGRPGEEYRDAARLLADWQREGILVAGDEPALFVYEQRTAGVAGAAGGEGQVLQRGLIGAVRLAPEEARIVLPHEDVMPGVVRGRRQLMEATQANLEPIFLLYEGGQDSVATQVAGQVAAAGTPVLSTGTGDGIRHTLWAVTDPAALAAIAADLAPRQALIADGNHRYASYLELQAARRSAGDGPGPWDYGLALLVDGDAFPPEIGAIHRVLPGLSPAEAVERAKAGFSVRAIPGGTAELPAALAVLAEAGQHGPAFLVAGQGQVHLLTDPDPVQLEAAMPAGRSGAWRELSTAVLQEFLLAAVWGIQDDEQGVRVVHHDADRAIAQADAAGGTAVIGNPLRAADVYAVAAGGERLPRKSTSFAPKPRTGLVLRSFAAG
ncbi:MAG TPA: DUF1015 domain-containing protein [Streptosporangiaceae bacterium]|nr:DUF1015 domain-containing protein [Streptosporangiaceae bacterium]